MARIVPDPYSLLIEDIKKLPVIASQDQEFWLAAAISCIEVVECTADREPSARRSKISVRLLLTVFERCIRAYEKLVRSQLPESKVPSWSQLLAESLEARERIFQFPQSARAAFLYLFDVDCVALLSSIETGAFRAREILIEGYRRSLASGYKSSKLNWLEKHVDVSWP